MKHISEETLQAYLEGSLLPDRRSVENHLQTCEYCRNQLAVYKFVISHLEKDEDMKLPLNLANRVMKTIGKEEARYGNLWDIILFALGIAASLITAILYAPNAFVTHTWLKLSEMAYRSFLALAQNLEKLTGQANLNGTFLLGIALLILLFSLLDRILLSFRQR